MSIRLRLILWYVGFLAVILVLFVLIVNSLLSFTLMAEVDKNLQQRAGQLGESFIEENDPYAILRTGRIQLPEINVFSSPGVYIQVMSLEGNIVRSDSLGSQSLPAIKEAVSTNLKGLPDLRTVDVSGVRLRVFSMPIMIGSRVVGLIQVAQSLRDVDATSDRVLIFLSTGTVLALALATIVGVFLTRQTLGPIDAVTKKAQQIVNTRDLRQRLPIVNAEDELGRLTLTINQLLARLDELFRAQIKLGADVSHELRSPLTSIRGNIDLIRRGAARSTAELQEMLNIIEGELSRMSHLVSDLMLLSQADAGIQLAHRPVELDTILLDVYHQAGMMAGEVIVRLGDEDQAMVLGDADRLKQLLLNLTENAFKHTPPGGLVTLSLVREDRWVKVAIKDTGEGVPTEALPHIFERFYRAPRQKSGGSGLGLSIAKWIAEAHGGDLTVCSEVGRGSEFTVWLPLARTEKDKPVANET